MANIYLFESTDAGAPTMSTAAGSLIAVLDAFLVTGYNSKPVTSITVASGVATVVCTAHGFSATFGKIIGISGATSAGLNLHTRISDVTADGFKFLCPGVANGADTGTITAKYAPLGWYKHFSGTNKAMYGRLPVIGMTTTLRVDDSVAGQVYARVLSVQGATGLDTHYYSSPRSDQVLDGLGQYWCKGISGGAASPWYAVSDGSIFYLFAKDTSSVAVFGYILQGFGAVKSFKPADVLNDILIGQAISNLTGIVLGYNQAVYGMMMAGGFAGYTYSQTVTARAVNSSFGATGYSYPSSVDGGLSFSQNIILEESNQARGVLPGVAIPHQLVYASLTPKMQISVAEAGKVYMAAHTCGGVPGGSAQNSCPLIDLTGPWR